MSIKNFVVQRIANKTDGTIAMPNWALDTVEEGKKKFYQQCGLAVDSENLTDAVVLLSKDGRIVEDCSAYFDHRKEEDE